MNTDTPPPPRGHNKPPVEVPDEDTLKADLNERYPLAQATLDEMVAAANDVPEVITDDETAGKVQLLLKKLSDNRGDWEAIGVKQARPWKSAGNIVRNWFKTKEDKCEETIKKIKPRYTLYLEEKAAREQREADERAEKARLLAVEKKFYADWDEALVELADYNARKAREEQEAARKREDDAREDAMWAEARAELAEYDARKAEERRLKLEEEAANRRKERKKDLTRLNREAKALGIKDAAGELTDEDRARYRQLIGENGEIPKLKELLQDDRNLLTPEERAELDEEIASLERLREERRENHAKAEQAREAASTAMRESVDHGAAAKAQEQAAPALARRASQSGTTAAREENRATRAEMKADNLTVADASRTYGDGGSVGTLTGSWQFKVKDWNAVPLDVLRDYIHPDAIETAIGKWKMDNQSKWLDRRGTGVGQGRVDDAMAGVEFIWHPDTRIGG